MSYAKLVEGDRVYFKQNGRKLHGVVREGFHLHQRGDGTYIPVSRTLKERPSNRPKCHADGPPTERKTRWIERKHLRKLPAQLKPQPDV